MKVQHTMRTNINYICRKYNVFFRTSRGSLVSVLDSHAGGPGSIPEAGGGGCKLSWICCMQVR